MGTSCTKYCERDYKYAQRLGMIPASFVERSPCAIIDCNAIIDCMASITVRNLKETTKRKLKMRAAANGNSMEQEIREILDSASEQTAPSQKTGTGADLAESIRRRFARFGGVELEPLPRTPIRDPEIR